MPSIVRRLGKDTEARLRRLGMKRGWELGDARLGLHAFEYYSEVRKKVLNLRLKKHPSVTPLARLLRKYSLQELLNYEVRLMAIGTLRICHPGPARVEAS